MMAVGPLTVGVSREIVTITLSLLSAAIWGASDFLGGIAARRMPASAVVMLSHLLSLGMLVVLALLTTSPLPHGAAAIYALTAGIAGGLGVIVLYKALALGGMGLTAAVSGVVTAALPVAWGFTTEGLPKAAQVCGFVVAVAAIWLIAAAPAAENLPRSHAARQGILLGAAAGVCFGALLILLKLAARGGVLWPLAYARMSSASLAVAVTLYGARTARANAEKTAWTAASASTAANSTSSTPWLGWSALALVATTGMLDASGNSFYTLATRLGRLDIAAVLGSLYPASTILLAALLLKERTSRRQTAGMALALAAVVLISA
jgi:drug/metabolite transporter (DMT)-like permease